MLFHRIPALMLTIKSDCTQKHKMRMSGISLSICRAHYYFTWADFLRKRSQFQGCIILGHDKNTIGWYIHNKKDTTKQKCRNKVNMKILYFWIQHHNYNPCSGLQKKLTKKWINRILSPLFSTVSSLNFFNQAGHTLYRTVHHSHSCHASRKYHLNTLFHRPSNYKLKI